MNPPTIAEHMQALGEYSIKTTLTYRPDQQYPFDLRRSGGHIGPSIACATRPLEVLIEWLDEAENSRCISPSSNT